MMRGHHRQHKSHRRPRDAGMSPVLMGDTAESAETGARPEIEVTSAMIEAGEDIIWSEIGGAELGPAFSASALAERVYQAMRCRCEAKT
jgi:hypothetical protein